MSSPVTVFATFRPHAEQLDNLLAVLETMTEDTRAEPGCRTYDVYRSGDDDAPMLHLFERYDDSAALEAHRASGHYKAYRAKLPDLLMSPVEVAVLSEVNVKG